MHNIIRKGAMSTERDHLSCQRGYEEESDIQARLETAWKVLSSACWRRVDLDIEMYNSLENRVMLTEKGHIGLPGTGPVRLLAYAFVVDFGSALYANIRFIRNSICALPRLM
jgi:hypothetical protein